MPFLLSQRWRSNLWSSLRPESNGWNWPDRPKEAPAAGQQGKAPVLIDRHSSPPLLEDLVNTKKRPKMEDRNHVSIILKVLYPAGEARLQQGQNSRRRRRLPRVCSLDAAVGGYFAVLEAIGDRIENAEREPTVKPSVVTV